MQVVLPDTTAPVRFIFESQSLSEDEYYDLCMANRDLCIERSPKEKSSSSPRPVANPTIATQTSRSNS